MKTVTAMILKYVHLTWYCYRHSQVTGHSLLQASSCPVPPFPDTPPGPRDSRGFEFDHSGSHYATGGGRKQLVSSNEVY